jgi:hypothetical protein
MYSFEIPSRATTVSLLHCEKMLATMKLRSLALCIWATQVIGDIVRATTGA